MKRPLIGISTSWLGDIPRSADDIAEHIEAIEGVQGVEINYRITHEAFHKLVKILKSLGLKIFSLHNFTPIPRDIPFDKASGDVYNLASPDHDERKLAVKNTVRTIELAHELEGPTVILHCGEILMDAGWDKIRKRIGEGTRESEEISLFLKQKLEERNSLAGPYFDALLLSLDKLLNVAQKYSVTLGIENRYSFHEIPQEREFKTLFDEFQGAPLVYWHDTGHFYVNQRLKTLDEQFWIDEIFPHSGGCHIHDVAGVEDHLPLGEGDLEFSDLQIVMRHRPDMPLILELKAGTDDRKVKESLKRLEEIVGYLEEPKKQGE